MFSSSAAQAPSPFSKRPRPVILCILDGWGHGSISDYNALTQARLPVWNRLIQDFPHTFLDASAHHVGLPEGQMGNSEVGHVTIGSGRVVLQDLPRIDEAIRKGTFTHLPAYKTFVQKIRSAGGVCHLMGLLSSGGVHSHQSHIIALADAFRNEGLTVKLHLFLDGRDTPPYSGSGFLKELLEHFPPYDPRVCVASLGGRYYGMDRDQRWDRVQKAFEAIVYGAKNNSGKSFDHPIFEDPLSYLQHQYDRKKSDEFVIPAIASGYEGIAPRDGLIHLNFRADRVRQLLSAFALPEFSSFDRGSFSPNQLSSLAGMTSYGEALDPSCVTFFPPSSIHNSLGEVIAQQGLSQLRAAETEKYAHVTFFFNGGHETIFPKEDRILVPSPQVATYDLQPEMSANALTEKIKEACAKKTYDLIVINYANADMVGHSGDLKASIQAVETVDRCLGKLCELIDQTQGVLMITADHGNVEQLYDPETHQPHTAHTLNPVPFVIYHPSSPEPKGSEKVTLRPGQLQDIAPTVLHIMGLSQPPEMTGRTLIEP